MRWHVVCVCARMKTTYTTPTLLRQTFISLLCLSALVFAGSSPRALAGTVTINRCLDSTGQQVFTDSACSTLGFADRMPVARQRPGVEADRRVAAASGARFGIGCHAHSPEAMRGALGDAISTGDVNAVSGLYQWQGANRSSAMATMRQLRDLTHRPVVAIELDQMYPGGAPANSLTMYDVPDRQALPQLRVDQHAYRDGGPITSTHFRLREDAGCLWLAL
jgi:hypothetical protein